MTHHKAVLDCHGSDVKTNTLIKTEGKYISYMQLYKGNEELFTTKDFFFNTLAQKFRRAGLERTPRAVSAVRSSYIM